MLLRVSKNLWFSLAELNFLQRIRIVRPSSGDPKVVLDFHTAGVYELIIVSKYDPEQVALKMANLISAFMKKEGLEPVQYAYHADVINKAGTDILCIVYEDPDATDSNVGTGVGDPGSAGCPVL